MKIAKRFLITLIVCLSVILLAGLLSFFISRPWYYRLFYPWDRYTGTVTVEIDGKPAAFTVEGTSILQPVRTARQGGSRARVSMHAGSYGIYRFRLHVEGLEQPIEFSSLKWSWQVIQYEVLVSIDREEGSVSVTGTVRETNDQGVFLERPIHETGSLEEESLSFPISW